jgi:large subunit ribosomal protein L28e
MSSHLTWMIIRNNNAYLLKKRDVKKPFSTEPNNLNNLSSFRYSGLVHKKSVGIVAAPDNKGFTVIYKKSRSLVSIHAPLCRPEILYFKLCSNEVG